MKLAQKTQQLSSTEKKSLQREVLTFASVIVKIYCLPGSLRVQSVKNLRGSEFALGGNSKKFRKKRNCPGSVLQLVHELSAVGQS